MVYYMANTPGIQQVDLTWIRRQIFLAAKTREETRKEGSWEAGKIGR
jgi:hypothetical protein